MIDNSPNLNSVSSRHRQIVDSATDTAIISTDLKGCVTSWNKGAERIIGYTEAEIAGRPVDLFFTPEDRSAGRMASELAIAIEKGHARDDGWRVRKDGSRFWASGDVTPLRDASGSAVGFVKIVRDRTAERKAHEDLVTSQEQLRMAQSAGGVGIFTLSVPNGRLDVTPEFCRLFGIEYDGDLTPEAFEALVIEEDREVASGASTRATGEAPPEVEYRIRRASDQALRWIHRKAQFIRDGDGHVVQMVGVATDVSQRRRAEDALRRSEAQFRALTQVLPNHVWTARSDGALDWCNDRFEDYCGVSLERVLGLDLNRYIHPDDAPDVAAQWKAARDAHQPFETELRIRRRDGVFRWHLTRAVPVESEDGRGRWIGSNTDIEDQKAMMASLEASNESLELRVAESTADRDRMWQLSTDVMIVADFQGVIRAINPAWTNILGWSADETVGKNLTDFVHSDDIEATLGEVRKLEAGVTVLHFENRYRRKDEGFSIFNWTAVPAAGFLHAVGRDVTAEHEAAAELERAREELRQSQKMEAVGQLTGGIAHDFNNLLTGIIGSLDLMQRRIEQGRPVDMMKYVSTAMTAANRAAALTHRLLAFSRRQPLDPRPVDANRLVLGMEDLLRRSIGESIRLEMVSAGGLWKTKCDAHQLENAILNLAINARDAMPDGGVLTVETCNAHLDSAYAARAQDVKKGQYVCISVTDTGVGMAQDVIVKAFEPFFTTKPIGEGTGLGLSMIYGFARQSEGYARIYSEVGKGTTVKIYLPRLYEDAETASEDTAVRPQLRNSAHNEVVLVVEDEAAVRSLVVDVLEELGYHAVEASDGLEGLRRVESDMKIDLLVTDVGLPGLNGRQLADAARVSRPDLKILFMTGYAENAAIAGGFLAPGMEMITKPFAIETVAQRIRDMIDAP